MKEEYVTPEVEVVAINEADIIFTSVGSCECVAETA